ncbi:DUF5994 family protein [Nocardioides sp.]|uniref:DUF5994 family protein n=1 Tax=Nocardioides sp. TaxID=35761 RepID=UPI00351659F7
MATELHQRRLAFGDPVHPHRLDGVWWPTSRRLSDQLGDLFRMWPIQHGRIIRVLYSPPDWDDQPRRVQVPGGFVKTGNFPNDDTRQLIVTMMDRRRLILGIIPPDTPEPVALAALAAAEHGHADSSALVDIEVDQATWRPQLEQQAIDHQPRSFGVNTHPRSEHPVWDSEGGHL